MIKNKTETYLPIHFSLSSAVRHDIYLLPWLVDTWKQWSCPRILLCNGFISMLEDVRSMECIVTEFVSKDSWEREDLIRELISDLKEHKVTPIHKSILSRKSPGTLKNLWNMMKMFVTVYFFWKYHQFFTTSISVI